LAKFAAGDVNTGGKFATVVDDTVGVPRLQNDTNVISGARGNDS
jgi:hypothetical protein